MAEQRAGAVKFKGNPVALAGPEIKPDMPVPDFTVVANDLSNVKPGDASGKVLLISSVPSLDTPVCDTETRRFNKEAAALSSEIEIWTISMDLPFAQSRWCGAAGVDKVKTLSDFRNHDFGQAFGVLITEGPLAGINARAIFVVGKDGKINYVEYVDEITSEPNYEAALAAAKKATAK